MRRKQPEKELAMESGLATLADTAPAAYLRAIGAYSFDRAAPIILAALVTEDPLLLIGASGTGKTFLLNSLSEALGLEHRHYNASLISFDDLVGFPFPDPEKGGVTFLQTPATVWGAESVLVDEISRCKPEHQNRLFSLIHERRIQGIALDQLRFRWAAMNPCSADQDGLGGYAGSEPLDLALADRFGLFIQVSDWSDLDEADQALIAHPAGEGVMAMDGGTLRDALTNWRESFLRQSENCPKAVLGYAMSATTFFNSHGVRISPRRARFITRSLLGASIVAGARTEALFREVLKASLPQATWGQKVEHAVLEAAHRVAWDSNFLTGDQQWVHRFHGERRLASKVRILMKAPSPDAASQAIAECIGSETPERVAALCLALYPAAAKGLLGIGADGIHDLGKVAMPILAVEGYISWQERLGSSSSCHPELLRFTQVLDKLKGARQARARQLLTHFLVKKILPQDPASLEREFDAAVQVVRERLKAAEG
jgi:MoxR-like ATPase